MSAADIRIGHDRAVDLSAYTTGAADLFACMSRFPNAGVRLAAAHLVRYHLHAAACRPPVGAIGPPARPKLIRRARPCAGHPAQAWQGVRPTERDGRDKPGHDERVSFCKADMPPEPKPNRPKARLPRGFSDRGAADIAATRRMLEQIQAVFERYGFEPVETPAIEYTDALGKFLPDQDRPNEGVFSFQDDDEQWLSLRYDLTAPLARYVAENFDSLPKPYRSYRFGWVFRNEKPGPGRYRQFMQFDADTVGSASPAADAEMCMMAADTMEALGIPRGSYVVKVNNRKILDGVMESIGLGGEENAGRRLTVLRAIDKLDRLGFDAVAVLLGPGRKDESGDFTKGAGLPDAAITRILNFTGWGEKGSGAISIELANEVTIANIEDAVAGSTLGETGAAELVNIK